MASCCGSCCLAMSTSVPNPSTCQSPCCVSGDGGAGNLSGILNSVGRFGTAITGIVAGSQVKGAAIKARAQTQVATAAISSTTMIFIVIVIALLIFWATR